MASIIPAYTVEDLLNHSLEWIAEIYTRAIRYRMNELKIQACLQRYSNEDLAEFNKTVESEAEKKEQRVAHAVELMNLPGMGYSKRK